MTSIQGRGMSTDERTRLLEPLDYLPSAKYEAQYARAATASIVARALNPQSLRQTRGRSYSNVARSLNSPEPFSRMPMSVSRHDSRLIAFFDVLGFSNRLEKEDPTVLHTDYARLIDEVDTAVFKWRPQVTSGDGSSEGLSDNFAKSRFLFDSLVLVSHDVRDITNVSKFILACTLLMEKGFEAEFPLRGAVGVGDFVDDIDRGVFMSPVFPSLVRAEKAQEWSGCHILPDAEALVVEALLGSRYLSGYHAAIARWPILPFSVPVKTAKVVRRWCLNWPHLMSERQLAKGLKFLISPKRENTRTYLRYLYNLPDREQRLGPELSPARTARVLATRSQFNFRMFDELGEHEPLEGREVAWEVWEE